MNIPTKTCTKCGSVKDVSQFFRSKKTKDLLTYHCKQCFAVRQRDRRDVLNEQRRKRGRTARLRASVRAWQGTVPGRYSALKQSANKRDLAVLITLAEFANIIAHPCVYCQTPLDELGCCVDRKDSGQAYVLGNVVPCCWVCNAMKSSIWTYDEFREIGAVIGRLKQLREAGGQSDPKSTWLNSWRPCA